MEIAIRGRYSHAAAPTLPDPFTASRGVTLLRRLRGTRRFRDGGEDDSALAFVFAKNMARRDLTRDERAEIGARLVTMGRGGDRRSDGFKTSTDVSIDRAAKLVDVTPSAIDRKRRALGLTTPKTKGAQRIAKVPDAPTNVDGMTPP